MAKVVPPLSVIVDHSDLAVGVCQVTMVGGYRSALHHC